MGFGQIFGDDIHPDFDFAARYTAMEPALGKQFRVQNLLQLSPIIQQNPWINQHLWLKTIFELADVREADYLLKTPEQFAQEMQQQAQMQMMAAKMQREMEVKLILVYPRWRLPATTLEEAERYLIAPLSMAAVSVVSPPATAAAVSGAGPVHFEG